MVEMCDWFEDGSVLVLDTFTIGWALCMYCGVCVEQCPTEAVVRQAERMPATAHLVERLHDREHLGASGADR